MDLPIIKIDVNGRKNLWGKTKKAVVEAFKEYKDQFDWIFKVALSTRQKIKVNHYRLMMTPML